MSTDPRFLQESGRQIYTGTELILKGALEARVGLITGYPGSPIADVFNGARAIKDILNEHGIVAEMANNEALAAARLNGSQMADVRAIIAVKSVGAHVASDGLIIGNLAKTSHQGGALVLIGDDPWSDSTQVPSDSRFLSKHLYIPVMEPSNFQELKDWVGLGLDLSKKSNLYLTYLVTTNLADGGGTVEVFANDYATVSTKHPVAIDTQAIPVKETVILSPRTADRELTLEDRYAVLIDEARKLEVNKIIRPGTQKRPVGFVASGLAYFYLEQVLETFGLTPQVPVLKFGITYPLDAQLLIQFANQVDEIVVIEEKRDFVESQAVAILKDAVQSGRLDRMPPVWGKHFPDSLAGIPSTKGLNPSILIERLGPLFLARQARIYFEPETIEKELVLIRQTAEAQIAIPQRTPTFCPGCPHRDSSSVFIEVKRKFRDSGYMKEHFDRAPVDLLFHGDTGCYTMLMFEPNQDLMHNYSGMGLGGGTGAGIDPFVTNKQVVFMGDSTFFHSGMIAISDAIKNGQDITFVILDNGTIAMTGHQPTPGQEYDLLGNPTVAQNIENVVRGLASLADIQVHRVDPSYRESYKSLIEDTILKDGVKVIIADKECGITYDRKVVDVERKIKKQKGFLPRKRFINLSPDVCEFCLECTVATGCPGLTVLETPFGKKLETDLSWCKSDGACTKINACPSFEEVIIERSKAPAMPLETLKPVTLPEIPRPFHFDKVWSAYVAGVGGMGIGVITAILVQAGMRQGYEVRFVDKKGLAIRNGGVYSHIHFLKNRDYTSPVTAYGKTDLILGLDILEAVRSIDPTTNMRIAHPGRAAALINTHKTPTIATLTGKEDFDIEQLENVIRSKARKGSYLGVDLSSISEQFLGNKLYANLMMLGMAYQKGLLPITLQNLRWAIEKTVRKDALKEDLEAFDLGRRLAISETDFLETSVQTLTALIDEKSEILSRRAWYGPELALEYGRLARAAATQMNLDEDVRIHFALRIYELIQYDSLQLAKRYVELVERIYAKDARPYQFRATKAAIRNLFKVMAIKDEVYVAHLLTSEEKRKRDLARYNVNPKQGDKIRYSHINSPEFVIFGKTIRFSLRTKDWQLGIMKHMKFLRALLPEWHVQEKAFRDWYIDLAQNFKFANAQEYERYANALEVPETVRGYREVRYPKMKEAQARAQDFLSGKLTQSGKPAQLSSDLFADLHTS